MRTSDNKHGSRLLPRELKRHLFLIEERIVESLAWEPGSPLFTLIAQANEKVRVDLFSVPFSSVTVPPLIPTLTTDP